MTVRQLKDVGAEVEQRCVCEGWRSTDPKKRGELLTPETVTLYDLTHYLIKPMTAARRCSYVELVASGPQPPTWFVSHWWGEPVLLFIRCIVQHAVDHGHTDDTAYWVCAYANNQHDVGGDVTSDPSESSFVKAIAVAEGRVLSVLDEHGFTYSRIWCVLEVYLGLGKTYEVITAKDGCEAYDVSEWDEAVSRAEVAYGKAWKNRHVLESLPVMRGRRAVGLTSTPCMADKSIAALQTRRQASFPTQLMRRAFDIDVSRAEASVASDKTHILNYIAGRRGAELELPPLDACAAYEQTDSALHGTFAAAGWRLMLEAREDMTAHASRLAASGLRQLGLSLSGCEVFDDPALRQLTAALPTSQLEELRLDMAESAISAEGARAMLDGLLTRLNLPRLRVLDLSDCMLAGIIPEALGECVLLERLMLAGNQLSGSIPEVLGQCVALRELALQSNRLTGSIPEALGRCVALEDLNLSTNALSGSIPAAIGQCVALEAFFASRNQLTGSIPETFGKCTTLEVLAVSANQLTGSIPPALGHCAALQKLWLHTNQLAGSIPATIGQCSALQQLNLQKNELSGELPQSLAQCTALTSLKLSPGNAVTGDLPDSLRKLEQAGQLKVSWESPAPAS